ncbi:uncharacterized protein LOC134256627 [Saccostrea cucullata]|uniref:uncharacterized protein LOC134256627 n=1 Tax=Saccostrea cuccullata TaxID=36930 RepID=UPI002ED3C468
MLIAARTPPMGSWRNPPERIMSILNLALQAVGLMRSQASDECEKKLRSANGLGQLREVAKDPAMRQEMKDSIEPVKVLLTQMFRRLYLKDKKFKCFQAATEEAIEALWEQLQKFGPPLGHDMKQPSLKKELKDSVNFTMYFTGEDGHYKEFEEVYGTDTTEEYRPSLQQKVPELAANSHGIPFAPSAQTARTVGKTVKCIACDKPRVIYSTHKLTTQDHMILKRVLDLYQYSCGCELQELMPQERERAPKISALLDRLPSSFKY